MMNFAKIKGYCEFCRDEVTFILEGDLMSMDEKQGKALQLRCLNCDGTVLFS